MNNRTNLYNRLIQVSTSLRLKYLLTLMSGYLPGRAQTWVENRKMKIKIRGGYRLVSEKELECSFRKALLELAERQGVDALGDYLEFGVYIGTSLACMHRVLEELGITQLRLFGFDSFEGLPMSAKTDDEGHWRPGQFKSDYEFTKQMLTDEGVNWDRVVLVKGYFETTLNKELTQKYHLRKASIIMVDCDLYGSTKEALEFCAPLIVDEAVILFDDWFPLAARNMGEKRAFDEFLKAHPYFTFEEFGTYPPYAKIFLVSRTF